MHKKLSLLLASIFLTVQIFSLQHMAEYGFEKHQHQGKTCEAYLFCEQGKIAGSSPVVIPIASAIFLIDDASVTEVAVSTAYWNSAAPRAPPAVLLT